MGRRSRLPEGVSLERARIEVRFNGATDAVGRLYALAGDRGGVGMSGEPPPLPRGGPPPSRRSTGLSPGRRPPAIAAIAVATIVTLNRGCLRALR